MKAFIKYWREVNERINEQMSEGTGGHGIPNGATVRKLQLSPGLCRFLGVASVVPPSLYFVLDTRRGTGLIQALGRAGGRALECPLQHSSARSQQDKPRLQQPAGKMQSSLMLSSRAAPASLPRVLSTSTGQRSRLERSPPVAKVVHGQALILLFYILGDTS